MVTDHDVKIRCYYSHSYHVVRTRCYQDDSGLLVRKVRCYLKGSDYLIKEESITFAHVLFVLRCCIIFPANLVS